MTKVKFFGVAVLTVALCGVVLAACASAGAAKAVESDPVAAAKLAKTLNGLKEGSASVAGSVVTLSGDVNVQKSLVVPAGVTLDLSGEGVRLILKGGAVLTVNGVVKARGHGDHGNGWVEGSIKIDNGETVINGRGTIRLADKGQLLNIGRERRLTLDGVTLVGVKDNDASLVGVYDGELTLKNGKITGNARVGEKWTSGGGVEAHRATFTMTGGEISGNSAVSSGEGGRGGGVYITERSVFTMKDGVITGNTVSTSGEQKWSYGGGIFMENGGTFIMEGGAITGNNSAGPWLGVGGGVSVRASESVFIMKGGTISDNTSQGTRNSKGGGVNMNGGTFTMEGGTISGNSAPGEGGGVILQKFDDTLTFTMKGGSITGNSTGGTGGGICIQNRPIFTMEGGEISGNSAGQYGGGIRQQEGVVTIKGGAIFGNSAGIHGGGVAGGDGGSFVMEGGDIYGNNAPMGGGLSFRNWNHPGGNWGPNLFTMNGGRIQGITDSDGFAKNSGSPVLYAVTIGPNSSPNAVSPAEAKWGTGGTYTKGGVAQAAGSAIGNSDETLIAR